MADQTLPVPGSLDAAHSRGAALLEWLHSWVVTVDHKKLGILYIVYAIFFLLVAGVEALTIRVQLAIPAQSLRYTGSLQRAVHHARHDDGVFRRDADSLRVRQLSCSADDRRARHGLSAVERFQLLDDGLRRVPALFQLSAAATGSMAPARAPDVAGLPTHLSRLRSFLRATAPITGHCRLSTERRRHHWHRTQYRGNYAVHALPRHEAEPACRYWFGSTW